MFPLPQQLLAALENSPEVADFFNAMTSGSFADNFFHHLMVDIESGDLFTLNCSDPHPEAPHLAALATYNSAPLSGEPCIQPKDYASLSSFLDYCSASLSSALDRFQQYENEGQTL